MIMNNCCSSLNHKVRQTNQFHLVLDLWFIKNLKRSSIFRGQDCGSLHYYLDTTMPTKNAWLKLRKAWNQYKHRFIPWIAINLKNTQTPTNSTAKSFLIDNGPHITHVSKREERIISDKDLRNFLCRILPHFHHPGQINNINTEEIYETNKAAMRKFLGYSVVTRPSNISGIGVFVEFGTIKAGSIIGLYPGTIYQPHEPVLLQSIANQYIFRCSDKLLIDGNSRGISRTIFQSCSARDQFSYDLPSSDMSWLTPHPINPLSVGQYVNNRGKETKNNVVYQECYLDFPTARDSSEETKLPAPIWKFLPNVWSNPLNNSYGLKIVPLVAIRKISEGEEIISSYLTLIH